MVSNSGLKKAESILTKKDDLLYYFILFSSLSANNIRVYW